MNRALSTLFISIFAALVLALIWAGRADAQSVDLTWTQPTQNTDGSTIPATGVGALTGNRVEWGSCVSGAFGTKIGERIITPAAAGVSITGLAPGTYCFRAYASTTYGESAPTGAVTATVVAPRPNPPSGLTATFRTAYTVVKAKDRFVLLPVGTVPADTVCDTTQSVNGMYVVPRAAVTWSGSVRPDVVVARCG